MNTLILTKICNVSIWYILEVPDNGKRLDNGKEKLKLNKKTFILSIDQNVDAINHISSLYIYCIHTLTCALI